MSPFFLRWIFREIKNNQKFTWFFILILSLGLTGFSVLDVFKNSLEVSLKNSSKALLSADLSVSAKRFLLPAEIATFEKQFKTHFEKTRVVEFFSMVSTEKNSRLVQIKAIEPGFPFYGELKLREKKPSQFRNKPVVWVYPELLVFLDLKIGDSLRLGDRNFIIENVIVDDTTQTFRTASLAPRIYLSRENLESFSLFRKGTTLSEAYLFKAPDEKIDTLFLKSASEILPDPEIEIKTSEEAGQETGRILGYLSDYLGLVALVGLFLSGLGSSFLYRSFVNSRLKTLAIQSSLGLQKTAAQLIDLIHLSLLGLVSAAASAALALLVFPLIQKLLSEFSPIPVQLTIGLQTMAVLFFMGLFGSMLICLPYLIPLQRLSPSRLFQEQTQVKFNPKPSDLLFYLPSLVCFWGLSIWQSHSFQVGIIFFISLIGSFLILWVLGLFFLRILQPKREKKLPSPIRQALFYLSRQRRSSSTAFVALALGALLINILPQLKSSLAQEIQSPESTQIPSLFLFDIQDEQVSPLQEKVKSLGFEAKDFSPLIRARLLEINDVAFERANGNAGFNTREQEVEQRFRNRGFNLSYRERLFPSETVIAGENFYGTPNTSPSKLPRISVEKRFAERLGLNLDDKLKFDIQGVEFEGQVKNLRSVKWNSFQPNFFMVFEAGYLEEAPKIFLSSLYQLNDEQKIKVQLEIVRAFPNVSVIDIDRIVQRVLQISEKMSFSIQAMALLSVFVGLIVLFSIAQYQVQSRKQDLNLLKILGAPSAFLYQQLIAEFFVLAFLASLLGAVISQLVSYILTQVLFGGLWTPNWVWPLITVFLIGLFGVLLAALTAWQVMQAKPRDLMST